MLKPLSIEPREEHDDTSHQHKVGVVGICVSTVNGLFIKGTMFKKFEIRSKHMPPLRWKLLRENSTSRARARGKGTTRDPVACLQKRLRCRKCNRCKRDSERKVRRANSEMWLRIGHHCLQWTKSHLAQHPLFSCPALAHHHGLRKHPESMKERTKWRQTYFGNHPDNWWCCF